MTGVNDNLDVGQEIIAATREIFSVLLALKLADVEVSTDGHGAIQANVTSMVGLAGSIRGMLAVHCPAVVAMKITGAFLGAKVTELDEDVKDAIGEIANMVAGNLKVAYAGRGVQVELALPVSVVGQKFRLSGLAGAVRHLVTFQLDQEAFWVELMYVNK
ncbi:MAG: chemotaxis protein CheX [Desulfopila sp.]